MLAALLLALPLAQDQGDVHPPSPVEVLREQSADGGEDEMTVLFEQVEQRLREIDRLLYDASAGRPIGSQGEGGIEDLLKRTRASNEEVLAGIDRILDLAQQRQQQKQSGSGSGQQSQSNQPGQDGQSPLDRQSGQPGQREATPEGPGGDERPQPGGEPQGEEQSQGEEPGADQHPEGNQEDGSEPSQNAGSNPPGGATGSSAAGEGDGRWGDLPVHVRELFRAQGSGDMPPHYRDWIDAYYRRLNRKP